MLYVDVNLIFILRSDTGKVALTFYMTCVNQKNNMNDILKRKYFVLINIEALILRGKQGENI